MDKLKKLQNKQREIEDVLKNINAQLKKEMSIYSTTRWQELSIAIFEFAKIFTTGVVAKDFEEIRKKISKLEEVDPNYLVTLGHAEPYGEVPTEQTRYLCVYLLQSKWRSDSDLWQVLGQISDTIEIAGNPFAKDVNNG